MNIQAYSSILYTTFCEWEYSRATCVILFLFFNLHLSYLQIRKCYKCSLGIVQDTGMCQAPVDSYS